MRCFTRQLTRQWGWNYAGLGSVLTPSNISSFESQRYNALIPNPLKFLGDLPSALQGFGLNPGRCAQPCLKAFTLTVSMQTSTVGCFFLCVLGLVLAFLCTKILQDLRAATGMRSRGNSSFPASLIFPKPLWCFPQKSKVSRVSTFGFLAADKLRMCFGHFSWVITKQQCQPLLSIWKVSCFQPSPPWNNWGGKKTWLEGWMLEMIALGKGSFTQTLVALWVALFWQPGQRIAGHWQLTWGYGLERAPPRLLCACPPHFMPDSTMAGNFKLPFFTIGP